MEQLSIKNIKRQALQDEAVQTLLSEERLIVNWGTGVGKSRVAIRCIEEIYAKEPDMTVLLLVTETQHKQNWIREFVDTVGEERTNELFQRITMECYASFKNYNFTKWTLVVADEAHHLRSDMRTADLETIYADYFLALSATISERGDGDLLLETLDRTFGPFTTLRYDVNDAIRDGVLPEPEIYVVKVNLSEGGDKDYARRSEYMEEKKAAWLQAKAERGLHGDAEDEETEKLHAQYMYAASMRKRYIGKVKTGLAAWYIKKLRSENKRFICFCSDVKQAEKLGGRCCINAGHTTKYNKEVIDSFNNKETSELYAVGMIQEGQNLKDIDAGIIIQLDSKERSFKQRFGRVLRSEHPELYVMYVPNTQDEKYLATALADTDQKHIHGWTKPAVQTEMQFAGQGAAIHQQAPAVNPQEMTVQNISFDTLVGPMLNPAVYTNPAVLCLSPEKGRFVLQRGGMPAGEAQGIKGLLNGIYIDDRRWRINCLIWTNGANHMISLPWKTAWGLLMPLASAERAQGKAVTVTCEQKGNFNNINVYQDERLLHWAPVTIPKEDPQRINLVNNLVRAINSGIRNNA